MPSRPTVAPVPAPTPIAPAALLLDDAAAAPADVAELTRAEAELALAAATAPPEETAPVAEADAEEGLYRVNPDEVDGIATAEVDALEAATEGAAELLEFDAAPSSRAPTPDVSAVHVGRR
jgi:hypothetical protein